MKEEKAKGEFDDFAINVITPIMNKIYEVAFDCLNTYECDSDVPVIIPFSVKEGVLEILEKIIQHCEKQKSFYASASIIGFALGRDGMKPSREYEGMSAISQALFDLIKAKDDQIKEELNGIRKEQVNERLAFAMGF
jgi:hypothetical protein